MATTRKSKKPQAPRAEARGASAAEKTQGQTPRPPGRPGPRGTIRPHGNEVSYSGRVFRSTLEARWAIYLDLLGINWDYEPSHYQISPSLWYLPDFYLPELAIWLEVKGVPFMDAASISKIINAVAGPRRIPQREYPHDPSDHLLLGGSFMPLGVHETPIHTLVSDAGGRAAFSSVKFTRFEGMWMLAPVGSRWGTMPANGVQVKKRPVKDTVQRLLEPKHLDSTPDETLAEAYRFAHRAKFDAHGNLTPKDNDLGLVIQLSRRRAGRPLPKSMWPAAPKRV